MADSDVLPMSEWQKFKVDLEKYYRIECGCSSPTLRQKLQLWGCHFSLQCVAIYRFNCFASRLYQRRPILGLPFRLWAGILTAFVRFFHHVDVFAASIGPGFYIGHLGTIYVGRCEVGANFSLTHNVTLGGGGRGAVRGLPRIGDNVWLGTGTIVFGDIAIGDGVAVMSGSIVSFNIPRRSLVGGNPARVLLRG